MRRQGKEGRLVDGEEPHLFHTESPFSLHSLPSRFSVCTSLPLTSTGSITSSSCLPEWSSPGQDGSGAGLPRDSSGPGTPLSHRTKLVGVMQGVNLAISHTLTPPTNDHTSKNTSLTSFRVGFKGINWSFLKQSAK